MLAIFFGALIGSLFSSLLSEQNTLIRLTYTLVIFFLIGLPEVLLVRHLPEKLSCAYLLNGERFPYFSLGFAGSVLLIQTT